MDGVVLRGCLVLLVVLLGASFTLSSNGDRGLGAVVVTVLSQGDAYHAARAREKREQWLQQPHSVASTNEPPIAVLLAHELTVSGATWTLVPLISFLAKEYQDAQWYFFAGEETQVNFEHLRAVLKRYDSSQVWFLGHSLKDQSSTIIHHYLDHTSNETIHYPNLASGWALSRPALKQAAENARNFTPNFNIDPSFELAVFLKYMRTPEMMELHTSIPPTAVESGGYLLTHVKELCMRVRLTPECATAYHQHIPDCGNSQENKVFFAVKTCEKFHATRLPVVQGTWGPDAEPNIAYYSEVEDVEFHTTDIGVPNTERGHCGKTMAIINRFHSSEELQDKAWLVIADDDTLLSVSRLTHLLACLSPHTPLLLGEVYGYNARHPWPVGYSFITGGGSMVLNREAVEELVRSGVYCREDSTPDDMFLGRMSEQQGIHIIHSPLFHQAQPSTFHSDVLALQEPISFHRHRPSDPYTVYTEYLSSPTPSHHQTQPPHSHSTEKTEL